MADLEAQIRTLADRRFASTKPVELAPSEMNVSPRARIQDADAQPNDGMEMIMRSNENVRPRRRWYLSGAAAGLVAVAVFGAALIAREDPEPASSPAEEVPIPTPSVASFGAESSLAVAADYFAAHDAGDIDSVFALFTSDATYSNNWTTETDRAGWEPMFAWDLAQGERLISPDCEVIDETPGVSVSVSCEHGTLDAVGVAVDAEVIPTTVTMSITPNGILTIREVYGHPDFATTGRAFSAWMEENHPEDADAADCCQGETVEESIARGELRARYAIQWAEYVEANGCHYTSLNC